LGTREPGVWMDPSGWRPGQAAGAAGQRPAGSAARDGPRCAGRRVRPEARQKGYCPVGAAQSVLVVDLLQQGNERSALGGGQKRGGLDLGLLDDAFDLGD